MKRDKAEHLKKGTAKNKGFNWGECENGYCFLADFN